MTARDRVVLIVLLVGGLMAGFWFGLLAPKRQQSAALSQQITAEQTRLQDVRRNARDAQAAKTRYDSDYATIAQLGRAVPADDNVPSLIYQLETAATGAKVDFRGFKTTSSGTSTGTTSGIGAVAAAGAAVKTNGATDAGAPTAPASQAAVSTLPPGATVGAAGFPTMPFAFTFEGSFFDIEKFFTHVQQLVTVKGQRVDVTGRLLSIDGFALAAGRRGFPQVKATMTATTYLLPAEQGLTGGATPQSPAAASTASSGATTTATVTGVK